MSNTTEMISVSFPCGSVLSANDPRFSWAFTRAFNASRGVSSDSARAAFSS